MNKYIIILLCCFSCLCISCRNDSTSPKKQSGAILKGRIFVEVNEGHDVNSQPSVPEIKLYSETEKEYVNCNYNIITEITHDDTRAIVNYSGIDIPDIALPALGPASSYVNLPFETGQYLMKFNAYGRYDSYRVNITDDSITLQPLQTNFTACNNPLFWRFKPNSFVYLFGSSSNNQNHYESLVDSLVIANDLQEFEYPDYGVIPYAYARNWQYSETPPRYFIYQNDEDFEAIKETFAAYVTAHIGNDEQTYIRLVNWKNEQYRSNDL